MGSSGGSSDGGGLAMMMQQANPMPGLPVAGKDSPVIDPAEYGKFQSFLPEPLAEGENPMATGLRPEMLQYKPPQDVVDPEIAKLRGELAGLKAQAPAAAAPRENFAPLLARMSPQDIMTWQNAMRAAGRESEISNLMNSGGGGQQQAPQAQQAPQTMGMTPWDHPFAHQLPGGG